MSQTIKSIETIYNGYRFRSRLEARWAHFFDRANWKYQYEPEGFEFESLYYLPDFYLPDADLYVEIKPEGVEVGADVKKARLFGQYKSSIIIFGSPGIDSYKIELSLHLSPEPGYCDEWLFAKTRGCGGLGLVAAKDEDVQFVKTKCLENCACGQKSFVKHEGLEDAYISARQARFEHGEKLLLTLNKKVAKKTLTVDFQMEEIPFAVELNNLPPYTLNETLKQKIRLVLESARLEKLKSLPKRIIS